MGVERKRREQVDLVSLAIALISTLELLIIGCVLLSWVDPNPYPTNEFKRVLFAITDPILEPLRRYIPPLGGMLDVSPVVAIVLLNLLRQLIVGMAGP